MSHCKLRNDVLKFFFIRKTSAPRKQGAWAMKKNTWASGTRKIAPGRLGQENKSTWASGTRKKSTWASGTRRCLRIRSGECLEAPPSALSHLDDCLLNLYKYKRIYKCAFSYVPPVLGFPFSALSMFNKWPELTNAGSLLIFAKNLTCYSGRVLELPQLRTL